MLIPVLVFTGKIPSSLPFAFSFIPNNLGMEGPVISASSIADLKPLLFIVTAIIDVTRDFPTEECETKTPCGIAKTKKIAKQVVIVPILRAGLGMVDGIRNLIPTAKIGHIGLYRDEETLEPHEYYVKFPQNMENSLVLVVDPMLATGGSVCHALDIVKKTGAKDVRYVGLVGAPEGVKKVQILCL